MNEEYVRKLHDCELELNDIKKWSESNPVDSRNKYLNAYAVVRSSGVIEVVMKQMVYEWLSENAKEDARAYLETMIIDSPSNPKTGIMGKFLENINGVKKDRFESAIKSGEEKAHLNSLVNLRNDVAHGRAMNTGIDAIIKYFHDGVSILKKFDLILRDVS